jgi:antitoxin (DNA-binding transcriptional repressor) of toxin-antitoxin stability system
MEASILDLRYKMRDVLKALNRREKVTILYHGRKKGEIIPFKGRSKTKTAKHPIFGMIKRAKDNPTDIVSKMRRRRQNAV